MAYELMNKIVSGAESLKGKVKYVFGGDNIEGGKGDCSDFTQYVYAQQNLSIGGTTQEQYMSTAKVTEPQEGDLVFFKDTYDSGYVDGVSHVGIYTGDNKFIHLSSGAGTVVESDLSDSYYQEHFLSFGRVGDWSDMVVSGTRIETKNNILRTITVIGLIIIVIICLVMSLSDKKKE